MPMKRVKKRLTAQGVALRAVLAAWFAAAVAAAASS